MKIMISQPMKGKTEETIRNEREPLIKKLTEEGHTIIDTVFKYDDDKSLIYYLAKAIEKLDEADAVIFMEGWQKARGCVIEHDVALKYGKYIKEM